MRGTRVVAAISAAALLAGCGGGGSGDGSGFTSTTSTATPTPTATATPTSSACTLSARESWVLAQMKEWWLFPDLLVNADPAAYTDVSDYLDALTATARAQRKDRYFTYLTSIAQENAYYTSGASAGFGFRLALDSTGTRLFVAESFENTSALSNGVDRGAEILAIGTSAASLQTISQIAQTADNLTGALGPDTAGTQRAFQIHDASGTRTVTLTKTDYSLDPVSSRYGAKIITDNGQQYGYLNLRTFIDTADPELQAAFAKFKAAGVTNIIVDLRYNGGGLIAISEEIGDLLGAARSTGDVLDYTVFRPEKSAENATRFFAPGTNSVAPTRLAFIGTGGTASASELTINAELPYFGANAALIGSNTYGKPVGQIALDKPECDDRLRVIAFATQNAAHQGDYYDGLAGRVQSSCQAADDYAYPLGDPNEASTRTALNFLEGKSCTPISTAATTQSLSMSRRTLLQPTRPTTAQREVPGLF